LLTRFGVDGGGSEGDFFRFRACVELGSSTSTSILLAAGKKAVAGESVAAGEAAAVVAAVTGESVAAGEAQAVVAALVAGESVAVGEAPAVVAAPVAGKLMLIVVVTAVESAVGVQGELAVEAAADMSVDDLAAVKVVTDVVVMAVPDFAADSDVVSTGDILALEFTSFRWVSAAPVDTGETLPMPFFFAGPFFVPGLSSLMPLGLRLFCLG
jgi:hypothetical protein